MAALEVKREVKHTVGRVSSSVRGSGILLIPFLSIVECVG